MLYPLKSRLFITGTDTDIGKTVASAILLQALKATTHAKISYFKPFQTGPDIDTETILRLTRLNRESILPTNYTFNESAAPYIAATHNSQKICFEKVVMTLETHEPDYCVIEGCGGFLVPIAEEKKVSDLIARLHCNILLVTSGRLGTINHTLLSAEAIANRGLKITGLMIMGDILPAILTYLKKEIPCEMVIQIPWINPLEEDTVKSVAQKFVTPEIISKLFQHIPAGQTVTAIASSTQAQPEAEESALLKMDHAIIWHPYTQHGVRPKLLCVKSAKGTTLTLTNGHQVLDAISSWWVNIHGHCHPKISHTIFEQSQKLEHVLFAGCTHQGAIELACKILDHTRVKGSTLNKIFYSDNGSTAVEVALKMAYQYQIQIGQPHRKKFLALRGSYHGDTFGAMSVGDPEGFRKIFTPLMAEVEFVHSDDFETFEGILRDRGSTFAAFIFEPLVQGASGMRHISRSFLNKSVALCKSLGVLTIADEVFTGFYRTGKCFASEHLDQFSDLLCLSKGLTGGFLPLAMTLTTEYIFQAFLSDQTRNAFLHGHSYTANPIACAAGLASWELLQQPETQTQIQNLCEMTKLQVEKLQLLSASKKLKGKIRKARSIGTIGAIELQSNKDYFSSIREEWIQKALQKGVLLRPLGNVFYSMPPYCVSPKEMDQIYQAIREIIEETPDENFS